MSDVMVINLGLPKSGTTTLARALRRAGLNTADFRIKAEQTDDARLHGAYVAELMYQGYFNTGDPLHFLQDFSAFSEVSMLRGEKSLWPQMDFGLISALRAEHPNLKFVASWRAPVAISDSMLRWSNLGTERLPGATVPGLPAGFGQTTSERVRWIEGHYAALQRFFAGSDDFLLYDTAAEDAPDRIARFIKRDLPWWGKANVSPRREVA
ncbi:hypothetical protein ACS3SW_01335 [Roseobacteraceae bacterium S113]